AAYIRGMQNKGIAACPKHFAANNQELRRMSNDSIVDERTFREIYTTGFEIAVKEGKAKAIMSSYNLINGEYANESKHLLQEILVDEWGFNGIVVSDWGGSNDHALGVKNGSHLEMPSTGMVGATEILDAIKNGSLSETVLDQRLDELLTVILSTHNAVKKGEGTHFDIKKHHEFARQVARESVVLLKNEAHILPLNKGSKVTVLGHFAEKPRYQGAGSSLVNPTGLETTLDEFQKSGLVMTAYEMGYERNTKTSQKLIDKAKTAACLSDYVIIYAGLDEISESEGMDRNHMKMPKSQTDLIEAISEVNKNIIVVLSAGSSIEMPWIHKVKAVVHGYLSGQAGASAMLDALTGKFSPAGKLNETYPLKFEDTPTLNYFPGMERTSEYRESLYVGYRYYETVDKKVLFPFGYGLSYTTFSYSDLQVSGSHVNFTIKNIGSYDGAEIAQLYVSKKSDNIFRPVRELKGFSKIFLRTGEEKEVSILLDDKAFRYYNIHTKNWEVESGDYNISVGINSHEMVLQTNIFLEGTNALSPYSKEAIPAYFSGRITDVENNQFAHILNFPIPDSKWNKDGLIGVNDAICQLYYAKSFLARIVYKILTALKNHSEKKGKPNLNLLFIYNMPFRGIAKMTGGLIDMAMVNGIVEIVNGKGLKGLSHLIKAISNKRSISLGKNGKKNDR
ncbi:MAG: Beta-glucosidase-related glycosidase, partial [Anaerocolumna sp.]|nr:Beta-glucosidase-related glycosidase [Anaerocolumna sp.]